jgi:hypothetical protein
MWEEVMTDNLKHCMCGCIYEQANCPNCNKTPDRELIARVRDTDNPICDTDRIAAADRIEGLRKNSDLQATLLGEAYDKIEMLMKERDAATIWATEQHACADNYALRLGQEKAKLAKAVQALELIFAACDQGRMIPRSGAGGMTIEANIRGSVYTGVPAWPIEEARTTLAEIKGDSHD